MATYLVTGGAGFIGLAIVRELLTRGQQVRVLDNLSTGRQENLKEVMDQIQFIAGDLCADKLLEGALEGVQYVLHQATIPSVPHPIADPLGTHRANVDGTLRLLEAARRGGVQRVVYASSSLAYGDTRTLPKVKSMEPNRASPYAVSKLAGEYYARVFAQVYGLETVSLRYFNVFEPRQDPTSPYSGVLSLFITALLRGEQPRVYGDGEQSRDFTFVADAVEANLLACVAPEASGRVFNIATGRRYTLNRTLAVLAEILDCRLEPIHEAPRSGDVRHSQPDISGARRWPGYEPHGGFQEGLRETIGWYRRNLTSQFGLQT